MYIHTYLYNSCQEEKKYKNYLTVDSLKIDYNALFIFKKLVFRNQFFLFPYKDILGVVKVCLDIRPTADKMHRQIEFKQLQSLLTQLSILFGNTFFHTCICAGVQGFFHISSLHTHFCGQNASSNRARF